MASPSFDLGLARGAPPVSGGRPTLKPRQWQRRLIQLLRARLAARSAEARDVLVHAGPGAGKTLGALLGFQQLLREGRLERYVVFCHRCSITRQWISAAGSIGLGLVEWDPQHAGGDGIGLLVSYQSAARHRERLELELQHHLRGCRWLAIADEVHHLGMDPDDPDAMAWGHAFTTLTRAASLRLGLSGTPFRADRLAFCAARRCRVREGGEWFERIVPDLCVEPRQLIIAGDVRPLEFRFQDGWVEHRAASGGEDALRSPLASEQRESWRARNLRRAISLADGGGIALRVLLQARRKLERVRCEHPGAGGLVVARDIGHARRIRSLLEEQGERVHLVHSQDPEAARRLKAFREGEAQWLVSIDMCAEGFDAPRLRVVAYLTTVVTRSRFVQAITRAVRMDADRSAVEGIPRLPSYVYAPADPLLLDYARSWTITEPYLVPAVTGGDSTHGAAGSGWGATGTGLRAISDDPGDVIRMAGPQLPHFVARSA